MRFTFFLFAGALSAKLAAQRSLAAGTAEVDAHGKMHSKTTPAVALNTLTKKFNTQAAQSKSKYGEIVALTAEKVGEADPKLTNMVTESGDGIKRTLTDVATYKETTIRDSDTITNVADGSTKKMAEEDIGIGELAEDTLAYINDKLDLFADEQKETSERNAAEYHEALQTIDEDGLAAQVDQKDELTEALNDMQEAFSEVGDQIQETTGDDMETYKDMMLLHKELYATNKVTNKAIISSGKSALRDGRSVQKIADKAGPTLISMRKGYNKDIEKAIGKISRNSKKAVKSVINSAHSAAEEVEDSNTDRASNIKRESQRAVKDYMNMQTGIKRDDAATALQVSATESDAATALSLATDEAESLEEASYDVLHDNKETLSDQVDDEEGAMVSKVSDLEGLEADERQNLESAITEMDDQVSHQLSEGASAVETNAERSISLLQSGVSEGQNAVAKSIEGLAGAAGNLNAEINTDNLVNGDYLRTMQERIVETAERAKQVESSVTIAKGVAADGLKQVETGVLAKMSEADGTTAADAARATAETTDLAATITRDLLGKVKLLGEGADQQLGNSQRSIAADAARGSDILAGMKIAVENIEKLKENIEENLPEAKKTVSLALGGQDDVIDEARGTLTTTESIAKAIVHDQEANMRTGAETEITAASERLDKQLFTTGEEVESNMESIDSSILALKEGANDDYKKSTTYADGVRRSVEQGFKDVTGASEMGDYESVNVNEAFRLLQNGVNTAINEQERQGTIMQKTAVGEYLKAHEASKVGAQAQIVAALDASHGEIAKFVDTTKTNIGIDQTRIEGYIKKNEAQIEGVRGRAENLANQYIYAHQSAAGAQSAATTKLKDLKKVQAELWTKQYNSEQAWQQQIDGSKLEMQAVQTQQISAMTQREQSRIQGLGQDEAARFSEEQTRIALLAAKTNSGIQIMENRLRQQMEAVSETVKLSRDEVTGLENGNADATKELHGEMGAVHAAQVVGGDAVKKEQEGEEKQMASAVDGHISLMETVMGAFSGAKDLAGKQLETMDEEFEKDINKYRGAGTATAEELTQQVIRLIDNAPDFMQMFASDTAEAKHDMAIVMTDKLNEAGAWTVDVMKGYNEKLKAVKEQRETLSGDLHTKASEWRRQFVTESGHVVNSVEGITHMITERKAKMKAKLDDFKDKLSSLAGVENNHDQAAVDDMEAQLFNLEATHTRLMDWRDTFVHHTAAWREEVQNQLRKLGRDVGGASNEEAEQRLAQEMGMNTAMRAMQLRVEGAVAQAGADQTTEFGHMADQMSNNVQKVLKLEAANEETKRQAQSKASTDLQRREAQNAQNLNGVEQDQAALATKADSLDAEAERNQREMGTMFHLPSLTTSDYNVESDTRIENLHMRTARMKAIGARSFLEEGSNNLRTNSSDEDPEEKAILDLNKELSSQNEELESKNERLGHKLTAATEKVKDRMH